MNENIINNTNSMIANVDRNNDAITNISNIIDEVYSDNKNIGGDAWNYFKNKAKIFNDNLVKFKEASNDMSNTIKTAINRIDAFFDSYSGVIPLPTSNVNFGNLIAESAEKITALNIKKEELAKQLYTSSYVEVNKDANGVAIYDYVEIYHPEVQSQIDEAEKEIKDLEIYKSALSELESIVNEENNKILNTKDTMNQFTSRFSN